MLSLSWLDRDGKLIVAAKGIRAFGYGFSSVLIFIYLNLIGFNILLDGIVISIILVGGTVFTFLASVYADRNGRKKFLIMVAFLMAVSGLLYAFTTNLILLMLGAFLGAFSPSGGDAGSLQTIEQAILPQTCKRAKRNSLFATYNMIGRLSGSAGALFAVLPSFLQARYHLNVVDSFRPIFIAYAGVALATALIYWLLTQRVELIQQTEVISKEDDRLRLSPRSRSIITKLSLLMGLDSFGGGFALQSIISYWFYVRYGATLTELSLIFFVVGILSAIAFIIAGRLADRIGAINTMVFTHLPSSVFLMLVPIAPTFLLSLALYLVRQPLSLMDIPARQTYVVSVVAPSERTFASGMSNVARNSAQAISPSISGLAMQFVSISAPFFLCGFVKIAYDVALYSNFRKIKESEIASTE